MSWHGKHDFISLEEIVGKKGPAVKVNLATPLTEVSKILTENNFLAVPIWDEDRKQFVGFIDQVDIVSFAALFAHPLAKKKVNNKALLEKFSWLTEEVLSELSFTDGSAGDILELPGSERRRTYVFQSNAKLDHVMKILEDQHRVLVVHEGLQWEWFRKMHKTEYKLCTRTDVVKFLLEHIHDSKMPWHNSFQKKQVKDISYNPKVLSISSKEIVLEGFLKMLDEEVSYCAVLDENGKLEASLTPSCLRGINNDNLQNVNKTVKEFQKAMAGGDEKRAFPIVQCTLETDIAEVMKMMLQQHCHECWIVDAEKKPIGVVTFKEIIHIANS